jgi:hypothetical protein
MNTHTHRFMARIFEGLLYQCNNPATLPFLHTMLVSITHVAKHPAVATWLATSVAWEFLMVMLNYHVVSLDAKLDGLK